MKSDKLYAKVLQCNMHMTHHFIYSQWGERN